MGARNQKVSVDEFGKPFLFFSQENPQFFVNFLQWSAIFSFWLFGSMLGLNVKAGRDGKTDFDPEHIVVIAL